MLFKNNEWLKDKELEILSRISPEKATRQLYEKIFDRELHLDKPKYFCEKLHYLKLNQYYNNPLVTACIDKYEVKNYMRCMREEDLCAKLYGVYNRPEEIEWNKFPEQFVIKCTHGCGYNIICRDKRDFSIRKAEKQLRKWMRDDYWVKYAETQYRFVKKRIIVEEYLGDNLITYRFCCFHGEPKFIYVMTEESGKCYVDYFGTDWSKLDYKWIGCESDPAPIEKPDRLDEMLRVARLLSRGFPFVRIDLYSTNGSVYLSEFTFLPAGGIMKFDKRSTARMLGSWIDVR